MVLPLGATKGTGLAYALHELGYSPHNVAACGDAENDRSLFEVAEYAAAVANAPARHQSSGGCRAAIRQRRRCTLVDRRSALWQRSCLSISTAPAADCRAGCQWRADPYRSLRFGRQQPGCVRSQQQRKIMAGRIGGRRTAQARLSNMRHRSRRRLPFFRYRAAYLAAGRNTHLRCRR